MLTFRMQSVTDSRWVQSKHDVEILSNHNKATKIAYFASAACELLLSWGTELEICNIQSEKQQQRDANCL